MNHTQQFHEDQIIHIGDGLSDGFYLVLLGASDVPLYFPIAADEQVPGDYLKLLRQYRLDVGGVMSTVQWIMYGNLTANQLQLVSVIDMQHDLSVYPNLYQMKNANYLDGYYLALVNLDQPAIKYFGINEHQLMEGETNMFKLLSEHVDDVRQELQTSDMMMLGQAKNNYFHVIEQRQITDF